MNISLRLGYFSRYSSHATSAPASYNCFVASPPSIRSGYSPLARIVPTASCAVCPVSHVSLTLTPVFSAIISWISFPSLISACGIAPKKVMSMISPDDSSVASAASAFSSVFASLPASLDAELELQPTKENTIAEAKVNAKSFLNFILTSLSTKTVTFHTDNGIIKSCHNEKTLQILDKYPTNF